MTSSSPAALVRVERNLDVYANDPAWQRIWLNLESENWRSLAVVPTGDLSSARLVHGLAAVAWQQRGTCVIVADLRTVGVPALAAARAELRRRVDDGERILIATQSLEKSPTAVAIAREADKAVLCVALGKTPSAQVRSAIREIGAQQYLGVIVIRPDRQ
jgi:hypothetical protein